MIKFCFSIVFSLICLTLNAQNQVRDTLIRWLDTAAKLYDGGDYANSANLALKCVERAEQEHVNGIIGKAYYTLARGAFQFQDYEKGKQYARKGFGVSRVENNPGGMGDACNMAAILALATNQLDSAFYFGGQAVQYYREAGNIQGAAVANTKLGHVFNIKGEYQKATPYYLQSYEMVRRDTLSSAFMTANLCLASNYIYLKKTDAALKHTLKSYQIAKALNSFYELSTSLHYLSGIYEQKGDYRTALKYQQQYTEIRDSVLNAERVRQVKELEARYEVAKKENAISALEKEKLQQRVIIWAGLAILTALLVIALQIYSSYRRRTLELRAESREAGRLAELDAFKSRFFTNISHEFRTPLTVILGMAGQLKSRLGAATGGEAEVVRAAAFIQRNGEHLLRLINQILDLAKLEANTLKLNYIQGDLSTFLPYLAESLHSLADERGVVLRVEAPETPVWMDYDPERLRQVVHNLVSNAIKFTAKGGEVLLRVFETGPTLKFVVSDTGIGIAPEDLPHVFDRFYQASNAEKIGAGGSGIGLSLTRELVRAMGGEITVSSTPGKGTAFTVTLPVRNRAETAAEPIIAATSPGRATPPLPSLPAENADELPALLIIEDNSDVAEYLRSCLHDQYHLMLAANGREGIEKALENVPDLILSDVMMPEKDGLDVCKALKNDARTSHIPIVLLTAKADVESRLAGLRRGADAYLAKPFVEEELRITVANLLEIRRKLQEKYRAADFGLPAAEPAEAQAPGSVFDLEDAFLQKTIALIDENLDDAEFGNAELSRNMLMSESQLHRKIKALTNLSLSVFIRSIRLRRGRALLQTSDLAVSEIAYAVGFTDPAYFSRTFSTEFGIAPTAIRKKES